MTENNIKKPYITVCIPTSDMKGLGYQFLKFNFEKLLTQSFKDFDICVSDNSTDSKIQDTCTEYSSKLSISYFKNPDINRKMCSNVNNVISKATGKLIKMLFLDDFLYSKDSLKEIVEAFDIKNDRWLITACEHSKDGINFFKPFYPRFHKNIHLGKNTISSPSVLTIINDNPLLFDENLTWLMDCDYYKRLYNRYGKPKILNKINVVNRVGDHQTTNMLADKVKYNEYLYMKDKYRKNNMIKKLNLKNVTLVAVSGINPNGAVRALELSMDGVDYYDVVLIAHYAPKNMDSRINFKKCKDTELVDQNPKNTTDYSKFMAYDLCNYIDSDYVLIVHNDAFVLRPSKWDNRFFDYDYIGAPWPAGRHFTNEGENVRVGNGGFSLRSKKMLTALNDYNLPFTDNGTGYYNEDGIMCVYYRKQLEDKGLKFAPIDIAAKFSLEKICPESDFRPFGYHNNTLAIPRTYFIRHNILKFLRKLSIKFLS